MKRARFCSVRRALSEFDTLGIVGAFFRPVAVVEFSVSEAGADVSSFCVGRAIGFDFDTGGNMGAGAVCSWGPCGSCVNHFTMPPHE
jgi:hypothetical protein